jgi:hypothetical protein
MHAASESTLVEWLLNALWLLLTMAAFWAAHRQCASRSRLPNRACLFITLACAATILFPAISLSDDLYSQQWAIEAKGLTAQKHKHSAVYHPPLQTDAPRPLPRPPRRAVGVLPSTEVVIARHRCVLPSVGRAPPVNNTLVALDPSTFRHLSLLHVG